MHGPGKYDDAATVARESTQADGVILIVVKGNKGSGFSVQAPFIVISSLPATLRQMADDIEKDLTGGTT